MCVFFVLDKENFLDDNWKKLNPDGAYSRCAFLSQLLRLSHFQIQSVLILVFLSSAFNESFRKKNQSKNQSDCFFLNPHYQDLNLMIVLSSSLICTTTGSQSDCTRSSI
jgi:hypothetical protein